LSPDLVSTSLTLHGAICTAAVLGIWKLGGESKFGTEKVADLHNLRPKLLKSVVGSLELSLNPILTATTATEPLALDPDGNPMPKPAKLSVDGKEALTNAVRDFVKADSQGLLDLREAQLLEFLLNDSLNWLRKIVWMIFVASGLACILMGIAKYEWLELKSAWVHALSFAAVALLVVGVAFFFWRILSASSLVDGLKSRYADIS
jgi:hypothetical protein